MPNISDFRARLNVRMSHITDKNTQKILRDLLDYAEGLEKKVALRLPQQPSILLGPKEIPGEEATERGAADKGKKSKTAPAKVGKPQQPSILLGPKEIPEEASGKGTATKRSRSTKAKGS
jgi:hypothetical protein